MVLVVHLLLPLLSRGHSTIVRRVKGRWWLASRAPEGSIRRLAAKAAGDKSVDDS